MKRPEWLIEEPAKQYHLNAANFMSSHQLKDFRDNPREFRRRKLNPTSGETEAVYFTIGSAVHSLALEPEKFEQEYDLSGPVNPRTKENFGPSTGTWKRAQDKAVAEGKTLLTKRQVDLVRAMAAAVKSHEQAVKLLTNGIPEGVVRTELQGIPCQVRCDWLSGDVLVDLKTCANLDKFHWNARDFQYVHQLAFYAACLEQEMCHVWGQTYIVAVEKWDIYKSAVPEGWAPRVGVWHLDAGSMAAARQENDRALNDYRKCLETDEWPTGYEDIKTLTL